MKVHTLGLAASPMMARKTACVVMLLAATGCTTLYEGKYDFSEGWREAQVILIAPAAEIDFPQFSDCRQKPLTQLDASLPFVLLSYEHLGRTRKRVVPLPKNLDLRAGDPVYMNVTTCDGGIVTRKR